MPDVTHVIAVGRHFPANPWGAALLTSRTAGDIEVAWNFPQLPPGMTSELTQFGFGLGRGIEAWAHQAVLPVMSQHDAVLVVEKACKTCGFEIKGAVTVLTEALRKANARDFAGLLVEAARHGVRVAPEPE